jgi:hypothetical protein
MLVTSIHGLDEALRSLSGSLDEQVKEALADIDELVASDAVVNHTFTNRTGRLERSIAARAVSGSFNHDTLTGGVTASMPYGSYLEDGKESESKFSSEIDGGTIEYGPWGFLAPALLRQEHAINDRLESALVRAIAEAGW